MPSPDSLTDFDRFWSRFLGCAPEGLYGTRTLVVPHGAGLAGRPTIWTFRRAGGACVLSVPPPMVGPLAPLAARHGPEEVFDRQFLLDALRHPVRHVTGPTALSLADRGDFRRPDIAGVAVLTSDHRAALRELVQACDPADWRQSAVGSQPPITVGQFAPGAGDLLAAAWYEVRGGRLAFVRALVRPAARGRGHGRAVAAGAVVHALARGLVVCWQAPEANAPAQALGRSLGCHEYASYYAIGLKAAP